jgi:hypothetical protein
MCLRAQTRVFKRLKCVAKHVVKYILDICLMQFLIWIVWKIMLQFSFVLKYAITNV